MKLERGLQSTHDLKKATYRMLRKLHSLEYRKALFQCERIGNNYYIVLLLQHMSDVIIRSYEYSNVARGKVAEFCRQIDDLSCSILERKKVSRSLLVACLNNHTKLFNWLISNSITIGKPVNSTFELWTMKCITSYIAQFKNDL